MTAVLDRAQSRGGVGAGLVWRMGQGAFILFMAEYGQRGNLGFGGVPIRVYADKVGIGLHDR